MTDQQKRQQLEALEEERRGYVVRRNGAEDGEEKEKWAKRLKDVDQAIAALKPKQEKPAADKTPQKPAATGSPPAEKRPRKPAATKQGKKSPTKQGKKSPR